MNTCPSTPEAMKSLSFDNVWNLDLAWFESPNHHRGGWSGVLKWFVEDGTVCFIKKQENYIKRTWRHPFKGELTASYEKRNLQLLSALSIPTPRVCFFSERKIANKRQAVLVTESLEGYLPLDEWLAKYPEVYRRMRKTLRAELAKLLSKLHQKRLAHCALYPKHIFIKFEDGQLELSLIDLEKLRRKPHALFCTLHDLNKLNRHLEGVSYHDRCLFLKAYLQEMRQAYLYPLYKTYLKRKFARP